MGAVGKASSRSRVIRVGRFVAIVWAVALCFQGVISGAGRLVAWAFNADAVQAKWALPNVKSHCEDVESPVVQSGMDAASARRSCWQLGLGLGVSTAMRNAGDPSSDGESKMREERAALARRLGISNPEVPPLVHAADALHEFEVHLEQDPQCTAARLTKGYPPACGAVYQFGAAFGHAWVYRTRAPQLGPMFVPQLRAYGARAGVPPELWAPAAADLTAVPVEQARLVMAGAVQAVDRFMSGQ